MSTAIGIVGMPNAGKSTLFNLLTGLSVPAENYPFNTIEPNIGIVEVRDPRVTKIASLLSPDKTTYPQVEFHDIAGLVKGAALGEGLGNQFLAHIREVDAIVLVLRGFRDSKVEHTLKSVDPKRDREVLESELILKDVDTLLKRLGSLEKTARHDEKQLKVKEFFEMLLTRLNEGNLAKTVDLPDDELTRIEYKSLQLLSSKPFVYLLNTDNYSLDSNEYYQLLNLDNAEQLVVMDINLEKELVSEAEDPHNIPSETLAEFSINELGIKKLINLSYRALNNGMFITAGKPEVRGWAFDLGAKAPEAAGVIHTDFSKKFIAAEVTSYQDFAEYGSWEKLKEVGKVKLVGKDYLMQDGDIVYFKIGA